ncbi:uncharacterized protein [Spinacia oleracea]|uniref:Reverse transcriptase domain-containing protein n=1 Tax=Spinacia oleracea TaxID=3562 RepID=A0ABM3QYE8_SPIOL|nr:uncharacterized protein LOC130463314 [Spinacia oleracea]
MGKFGPTWTWDDNYLFSPRGRIWLAWHHADITIQIIQKTEQLIHCWVQLKNGKAAFFLTVVYGLHTVDTRKHLWHDLSLLAHSITSPWCVVGDFNVVLYAGDRINGNPVAIAETADFASLLDTTDLGEMKASGNFFSWSNKGDDVKQGGRPFKFFNYMAEHAEFQEVVKKGWSVPVRGKPMFQLWEKLKHIKHGLKTIHRRDFAKLEERLELIRGELDSIQTQLSSCPTDVNLQEKERGTMESLKKFLDVQESGYRQKSRIQWLKLGDSNTKFFFTALKERYSTNTIDMLYDSNGNKLTTASDIKENIRSFYKDLIGTAAVSLQGVDLSVVRQVLEFFETSKLLKQVNNTVVTLILKIQNPTSVKDYRPIACCSVIYKLISKVITSRLQGVIGDVVCDAQAGFIPDRSIADNILLASELIKGYTRKYISPRCMIKIDLRKAYDSLEWPFLKVMLHELGFPARFVDWIMECLSTVSYYIFLNGYPTEPIPAKKGLRQGDPMSPFLFTIGMEYLSRCLQSIAQQNCFKFHPRCKKLGITHMMFADDLLMFSKADKISVHVLFKAFTMFSSASSLAANLDKSNVYMGGVSDDDEISIRSGLGMLKGSFPFRYLGVPLTTRKLKYSDCRPLVDKTVARVRSWSSKLLSYVGRLQLVKTVLYGMQLYWCQIFVMPKKVMREIHAICRTFLWTGGGLGSKKAHVAWEQLCFPKSSGGWNLRDLTIWNKAAVLKHCWALSQKQDRLWIKWVHMYYVKNKDFWTMSIPNGLTWSLRKIWSGRDVFAATGGCTQFLSAGKYKIQKMYKHLKQNGPKMDWRRLICNNFASPKSIFLLWLTVQNRLLTKDRLIHWHINVDAVCSVCQQDNENMQHLFFQCPVSAEIWSAVKTKIGVSRQTGMFPEELQWIIKKSRSSSPEAKVVVEGYPPCWWLFSPSRMVVHNLTDQPLFPPETPWGLKGRNLMNYLSSQHYLEHGI